jgi:hypothetical protein
LSTTTKSASTTSGANIHAATKLGTREYSRSNPPSLARHLTTPEVTLAGAMLYSLIRVVLDAIATSHSNEAKLRAEVLALRRQVQVLERQIKRVR